MNFEKHKDPKEALQIGIFVKKSFKNDVEASKFIMSHLETIVRKNKDSSKSVGEKTEEYIMKYITVTNNSYITNIGGTIMADPSLIWLIKTEMDKRNIYFWDKTFVK